MIHIACSREKFTYNAYNITKAFFPEEKIVMEVEPKQEAPVRLEFDVDRVFEAAESAELSFVYETTCNTNVFGTKKIIQTIEISKSILEDDSNVEELDEIVTRYREIQPSACAENEGSLLTLKKTVDRELYSKLVSLTGKKLPWGMLTGVRPTKLASAALAEGLTRQQFIQKIREEREVSEEKASLAWDIAVREKHILEGALGIKTYCLYINIPVCPSICSYCTFSSGSLERWGGMLDEYLDALFKELELAADSMRAKRLLSIYIGGGTPTSLSESQLERLLSFISEKFDVGLASEYTVEAGRPDTITPEKLKILKSSGVNRISINPQTMQQKTLDLIGRRHSTREVIEAFAAAREAGFNNINMDLIAGLPGEDSEDFKDTLRQIEALSPDSLTVHCLAIKRAAAIREKEAQLKDALSNISGKRSEAISEMIDLAAESAARMGMNPYYLYRQKNISGNFENIGYAREGKECIYNILIMEELCSIIACGAGAVSKILLDEPVTGRGGKVTKLIRDRNVKDIGLYISEIEAHNKKDVTLQKPG